METAGVALVTGAAGDIGFAIATRLAARGLTVIVCDRLADALAERVGRSDHRSRIHHFGVDLTDEAALLRFVTDVHDRLGNVRFLVNNASVQHDGDVTATTADDFDASFRINLRAPFLLANSFTPGMCAARDGAVVNISSVHGLAAGPARFAYATMKAGLIGMTRSIAADLGRYNVRANAVVPTAIKTTGLMRAWSEERADGETDVAGLYDYAAGVHAMKRLGEPDEVAELVEFLCFARYVTGEVVRVDGGLLSSLRLLPPEP